MTFANFPLHFTLYKMKCLCYDESMKALNKQKLTFLVAVVTTIAALGIAVPHYVSATLVCRSEACLKAAEEEAEASAKASEAQSTADEYQAKVNQLEAEVSSMSAQIAESEDRAADIRNQIEETQKKLEERQSALAELLAQIHFEGDTDTISILASSDSISDFAERQTRIKNFRNQINASADQIKEDKEKLEKDKADIEEIIESQKAMQSALAEKQAEQAELVAKYANDASSYAADAEKARAAKQAAMEQVFEANRSIFSPTAGGEMRTYTGANTYAWQYDCPGRADTYGTSINGHAMGGYVCECVSYAGWKAYEAYGVILAWGNANTWDDVGRSKGIVDHTPAAKTIAQTDIGGYGHVMWVESVNSDGSINITEYNNAYSSASGSWHDFGGRVIPASQVSLYNFIHVDRLAN